MLSGKFFAIASAILAAAVNASPVEVAKRDTQAGNIGNVYFCDGIEWAQPCYLFGVDSGICYTVPGNFEDAINSFGPDQTLTCTLFPDYNCCPDNACEGRSLSLTYPGDGNLADVNFANVTTSFRCISSV